MNICAWYGRRRTRAVKPVDMPMVASVTRESKGLYVAIIQFAKSKREYGQEYLFARTKRDAVRKLKRMYPHIKVGRR